MGVQPLPFHYSGSVQKLRNKEGLLILGALATVAILYYKGIVHFWFISDDAAAIVTSAMPLRDILFSPGFSIIFYTPLAPLSFITDVAMFGINPVPYHIHNVVILVLVAFMTYKILRLYTDNLSSLLPAVIVLTATPSLICILWIVLRQYLYAMLFSLLSVYLFVRYRPDLRQKPLIVFSILILSELSFMGKEQFMPLPFVLFLLSEGNFKERIRSTYPYFIILVAHFFLRFYILGGTGGYFGFKYDLLTYARTVFESVLTEAKVLFSYKWFAVIAVAPLLFKPRKLPLLFLLWFFSLSISLLVMHEFPHLDTYRYWFISTVLYAFMIGFNIYFLRNNLPLRVLYCLAVTVFFLANSLTINQDIKKFAEKESAMAAEVTRVMLEKKYRSSLILFPESYWLANSSYIDLMFQAYYRTYGTRPNMPFFPLELLDLHPEIIRDFDAVYAIRDGTTVDITGSVDDEIDRFSGSRIPEKPVMKLYEEDHAIEMELGCNSAQEIAVFHIKMVDGRPYAAKVIGPYIEKLNLTASLGCKNAEIIPIEQLSYKNRKWYIGESPLPDTASFRAVMCVNSEQKQTQLSDLLVTKQEEP